MNGESGVPGGDLPASAGATSGRDGQPATWAAGPRTFLPEAAPAEIAPQSSPPQSRPKQEPPQPSQPPAVVPGPQILATPGAGDNGIRRCVNCGASAVTYNPTTATFTCGFCRHQWHAEGLDQAMGLSEGIDTLQGTVVATAAVDIEDQGALVTLHCNGCGSDVVIDTDQNLRARCHWCRHELSLNDRVPNGAVPDGILPFYVAREQAVANIADFVSERRSFAKREFTASFDPANVMGVYLPYMTVDGNIIARLDGVGEVLERAYTVNDSKRYRVRRYSVTREFQIAVDDLVVSTASDKVNIRSEISTNNVISAILPFDVKNIVRFDSHFLGDMYTSERRDMDVEQAESYAGENFLTIARASASSTIAGYDRGVMWQAEQVEIVGSRWTSVLLPVWLYGYVDQTKEGAVTHYIAVNGRTGSTMGSVPVNTGKAALIGWLVGIGLSVITLAFSLSLFVTVG
jgi:hypothetical protein